MRRYFRQTLVVRILLACLLFAAMGSGARAANSVPAAKPFDAVPALHLVSKPSAEIDLADLFEVPGVLLRFSAESGTMDVATVAVVDEHTLRLTALKPGTTDIRVTATDTNGNFSEISFPVQVAGRLQTVSFLHNYASFVSWVPGGVRGLLEAISSVGLPVEFVLESGPAVIAGDMLTFTGLGHVVVAARQPGDADTAPAQPVYLNFHVKKGYQHADFGDLPREMRVNAPTFKAFATTDSGLPVTLRVSGPATLEEDGETITLTGKEGTVFILPENEGNEFYQPINSQGEAHSIVVSRLPHILDLPTIPDGPIDPTLTPIPLAAVSDSGLPVRYTIDSGPAELTEDGAALIVTGVGIVTVSAHQTGNQLFAPAVATISFSVTKRTQQIDFPEIADQVFRSKQPADNSLTLEAEASSGLPVEFTLRWGDGKIDGDTLSISRQSRFTVRARQPGNAFFEPAEEVEREFVARSDARIVFDAWYENGEYTRVAGLPAVIAPGSRRPFIVRAESDDLESTDIELELLSDTAYSTPYYDTSGWGVIIIGAGTPQNNPARVNPTGATGPITLRAYHTLEPDLFLEPSETFTVHVGRTQTIRFDQPKPMPLAQSGIVVRPTSNSKLPVALEVVSGPATVTPNPGGGYRINASGSGLVVLRATQPGRGAFAPAQPVEREWLVLGGTEQTLSFVLPATATYGDATLALAASSDLSTAEAPLPIRFSVVSGPGVISDSGDRVRLTGAGDLVLRATQPGGGGVTPTSTTRTVRVGKAPLRVSAVSADRLVGTPDFALELAYSGFINGDRDYGLDAPPRARTTATPKSPAGEYPIQVITGKDDNYEFIHVASEELLTLYSFGGTYEGLDASIATGATEEPSKVFVSLSPRDDTFTGTLFEAAQGKIVPFKGRLDSDLLGLGLTNSMEISGSAKLPETDRYGYSRTIWFTVSENGTLSGYFDSHHGNYAAFEGRHLFNGNDAPWRGAYTGLLLNRGDRNAAYDPLGVGWATAAIDARARIKLNGRLADDTPLTASLVADDRGTFRLLHNPYGKRPYSHFGGEFTLIALDEPALAGRYHLPIREEVNIVWRKDTSSANRKPDAFFPFGIGQLTLRLALSPWIPPVTKGPAATRVTLAQHLGTAADNTTAGDLAVSYGEGDLGARTTQLPTVVKLAANNNVLPPEPNSTSWALKLTDPKTGRFEGSFVLEDMISAPTVTNPGAMRAHKRQVKFRGVLRQPSGTENEPGLLGAGYLLLPPLPGAMIEIDETLKPAWAESHEFRLEPAAE